MRELERFFDAVTRLGKFCQDADITMLLKTRPALSQSKWRLIIVAAAKTATTATGIFSRTPPMAHAEKARIVPCYHRRNLAFGPEPAALRLDVFQSHYCASSPQHFANLFLCTCFCTNRTSIQTFSRHGRRMPEASVTSFFDLSSRHYRPAGTDFWAPTGLGDLVPLNRVRSLELLSYLSPRTIDHTTEIIEMSAPPVSALAAFCHSIQQSTQ